MPDRGSCYPNSTAASCGGPDTPLMIRVGTTPSGLVFFHVSDADFIISSTDLSGARQIRIFDSGGRVIGYFAKPSIHSRCAPRGRSTGYRQFGQPPDG